MVNKYGNSTITLKKKILLQPRAPIRRDEMRSQWIHQWGPVEKKSVTVEPTSDLFLGMVPTSQNSFSTTATCFRSLVSVPTPNNTNTSHFKLLFLSLEINKRNWVWSTKWDSNFFLGIVNKKRFSHFWDRY